LHITSCQTSLCQQVGSAGRACQRAPWQSVMFTKFKHRWEARRADNLPTVRDARRSMTCLAIHPELRLIAPLRSIEEVCANFEIASFAKDVKNSGKFSWASSGANKGEL